MTVDGVTYTYPKTGVEFITLAESMDFTFNDAIDETHESGEMGHYIYTYAEDGSTAMIALLINNSDVDAVGRDCDVVNVNLSGLFSIGKTVTLPCGVTSMVLSLMINTLL